MKKKNLLILLTILLFTLTSCSVFKEDKGLYDYKTEYVGNASATSNLVNKLNFDHRLTYDFIKLDYNDDINCLQLHFKSNTENFDQDIRQNLFNNCAYLFALIKNLDEIKIFVNGGQKFRASKDYIEEKKIFNKTFAEYFESEEFFYELQNQIKSLDKTAFIEGDINND